MRLLCLRCFVSIDRYISVLRLVPAGWLLFPLIRGEGASRRGGREAIPVQPYSKTTWRGQSSGAAASTRQPVQEQISVHPRQQDPAWPRARPWQRTREGERPGARAHPSCSSSPWVPAAVRTVRSVLHLRWAFKLEPVAPYWNMTVSPPSVPSWSAFTFFQAQLSLSTVTSYIILQYNTPAAACRHEASFCTVPPSSCGFYPCRSARNHPTLGLRMFTVLRQGSH